MFRKPQRVADSVTGGEPSHLMGSHPLFENGCTVKRFPFLASLPQQEVVELFHVEPVNTHEERQQDLYTFHEPYVDQKIVFRASASGKKPFKPTNAAHARAMIRGGCDSVYFGTYENKSEADRVANEKEKTLRIVHTPFTRGAKPSAGELLHNTYYLNSMPSDNANQIAALSQHRISKSRESRGSSQGPRPMSGDRKLPKI